MNLITDASRLSYANCTGWAYILEDGTNEITDSGVLYNWDVNHMELFAIIQGLKQITQSSFILIYTDSTFVINGAAKNKRDSDLWIEFYNLTKDHIIDFRKVGKCHNRDPRHARTHDMAREAVTNAVHSGRF